MAGGTGAFILNTACTDWKGAALTLMPPVWVGLDTDGKAADRVHGAGDCSDDRDIEACEDSCGPDNALD